MGYWCSFSSSESLLLFTLTSPGNVFMIALLMASTSLLIGQIIDRDASQTESAYLFSVPPKTKSRSSVSFSAVMSSGSLMKKFPLSLCCSSLPSPMLRRKLANCEDSPRSFALMFCVSCNLVTICQRYEDFSVASTISGLYPCRTTGKICRQSPAKSTVGPPDGDECFRMSCIVLSIDSNTCLCPIEIS